MICVAFYVCTVEISSSQIICMKSVNAFISKSILFVTLNAFYFFEATRSPLFVYTFVRSFGIILTGASNFISYGLAMSESCVESSRQLVQLAIYSIRVHEMTDSTASDFQTPL